MSSPHCPKCSRYVAKVNAEVQTVRVGEWFPTIDWGVYGFCKNHGKLEVDVWHCDYCQVWADWDNWTWPEELVNL